MGIGKGAGRGGVRAGAGRRAADGAAAEYKISARVDQVTHDWLNEIGQGNFSLGVRRVVAKLIAYEQGAIVSGISTPTKPARGSANPVPIKTKPARKEIGTHAPDGSKYSIHQRMKLQNLADDEYDAAMLQYMGK